MSENQNEEKPIRAKEVLQILPIGKNTLYKWCEQNLIPHKKVGRIILFPPRKQLLEWAKNNNMNEGGNA